MPTVRMKHLLGYMSAYLVMVVLGRMAVVGDPGLSLFWPAAGIVALWMLRGRTRAEVAADGAVLWVSNLLVIAAYGLPPAVAALFALANLTQGLTVRLVHSQMLARPFWGPQHARVVSSRELLVLVCASVAAGLTGAVVGTLGARVAYGTWSGDVALSWTVRNACGTLVIGAAALALLTAYAEHRRGSARLRDLLASGPRPHVGAELSVVLAVSVTAAALVFGALDSLPLSYLLFAVSAWVGFRFSPLVGVMHSVGLGTTAVLFALGGSGVFGTIPGLASRAVVVQLFVAVTTAIVLMLSVGVAERHALLEQVRVSEARATKQAELLNAVTSVMTDGLLVLDRDLRVVVSNPMADLLARTGGPGSVVGDAAEHGIFNSDGTPLPPLELSQLVALHGEPVAPRDYLSIDPATGREMALTVSSVPLQLSDDVNTDLAVVLLHDVTLDRARVRELEAFAGVTAHDLRNPLAAVQSWAMLLAEQLDDLEEDTTQVRATLRHVLNSAGRMQQLIDDLLTYAQARSGHLQPRPVVLDDLVDDIAETLRSHAPDAGAVIDHSELGIVHADPTLTRQLFTNVLGNAVKYVAPGARPRVHVTARPAEQDGVVEIHVTDNGIGIPEKERDRVFDSFYRARHDLPYEGTGLGLAICAHAVERHGGTIAARRGADGTGTTMVFTLPTVPGSPGNYSPGTPSTYTGVAGNGQRERRTTKADPPPRREGSDTAVS